MKNNGQTRKAQRQGRAVTARIARAQRSPAEQLRRLEARGQGHCYEAARLRAQLTGAPA